MMDAIAKQMRDAAEKMMTGGIKPTLPFDPFAIAQATGEVAMSLAMRPQDLMQVQVEAAKQWGDFWIGAMTGRESEKPRDRRFASPEWQDDAYYRGLRDAYLLASKGIELLLQCPKYRSLRPPARVWGRGHRHRGIGRAWGRWWRDVWRHTAAGPARAWHTLGHGGHRPDGLPRRFHGSGQLATRSGMSEHGHGRRSQHTLEARGRLVQLGGGSRSRVGGHSHLAKRGAELVTEGEDIGQ